ncbi:TatD family hydrolase [Puniceicoccales bacterium CK1056]|uniref:TatD family hydrolase n=1 Tax=Oceanipulchritudo coccoides TaxID=2706888 RepID=A0A6B2M5J8_9BACT|nr:TatD family hydrolase [Oceanipulchritudo coccoides]NDV62950.1 TatD family hydrolase [Oceanipulchritudo coccoides]
MLIDTHCHLEKAFLKGDGEALLGRMQEAGIGRCITVGTGPADWERYYRLAASERGRVDWTVGIHPCDVEEGWGDHIKAVSTYFATDPQPVALGEIGLDYFHLPKYPDEAAEARQLQERAFKAQLELAFQLDCPVVIHSRNAVQDCIRFIDASGLNWEKVVFHCFSDGPELLEPILERGGRASFTGILTYKNAEPVRQAALAQGLDRLMLETDSPYLSPEPLRGKPNEPANVLHIANFAAELFGVTPEELAKITTRNAIEFYGLSDS